MGPSIPRAPPENPENTDGKSRKATSIFMCDLFQKTQGVYWLPFKVYEKCSATQRVANRLVTILPSRIGPFLLRSDRWGHCKVYSDSMWKKNNYVLLVIDSKWYRIIFPSIVGSTWLLYGGFHNWGNPNSWMVQKRNIPVKWDDLGVPRFQETPISWLITTCYY